MLRRSALAIVLMAGLAPSASAEQRCVDQLNDLVNQWKSIAVPASGSKKSGSGQAHEHTAREVEYMRRQIRLAQRLCNEDKAHEAMLRMDVVRAWLKLPEVQHPPDHRYTFDTKSR